MPGSAADEASQLSGAAMVEGFVGAKLAHQLSDRSFARPGEEIFCGGSGVGRFPHPWDDLRLFHAPSVYVS
jgi:hypothetical protein